MDKYNFILTDYFMFFCIKISLENYILDFENRTGPKYIVNFNSENIILKSSPNIKVAVIREEGVFFNSV